MRLRRMRGTTRARVRGRPPSPNGASSFHLYWHLPVGVAPLLEASVVLEVVEPPAVGDTHFWALQAGFHDGRAEHGAGHLGLQWRSLHPGSRAVNWGGYAPAAAGGQVLAGSPSTLPSTPDDPNTRDYPWEPRRCYELRVLRGGSGWRGEVTDLSTGETTVVRELHAPGDRLTSPMVWSEVFARCDAPSTAVRWSAFRVVTRDGERVRPDGLRVNYQSHADGGCANTDVRLDGDGVLQVTGTDRSTPQGSVLRFS